MTHVKAFVVSSLTHTLNNSIASSISQFKTLILHSFFKLLFFNSLIYSFIVTCIHIHLLHYRCTWKGMRYGSGICTAHLKRNRRLTLDWKTSTDLNVSCEENLVKTFQRKNICEVCSQWGGKKWTSNSNNSKMLFFVLPLVM